MADARRTERLLGYDVTTFPVEGCVETALGFVERREGGRCLACLNPHSVEVAAGRPDFAAALRAADLLLPDGAGIVLASRVLGGALRRRVTGSDVFDALVGIAGVRGLRVFFLGSTAATLECIVRRLKREHPGAVVAGTLSPPFAERFSPEEDARILEAVNRARPDLLWVGMTAPRQELWVERNRARLEVPFTASVGAVFDFYAGTVRRSGAAFRRLGLEWLPRFLQEPRRLWRRNLVSTPRFLLRVLRWRLGLEPRRS